MKRGHSNGFTIVELIIVVAVIGILAAVVVVAYNGIQNSARDNAVLSDIKAVEAEVARFATKNSGSYYVDGATNIVWYSGGSANANIDFTPSSGNVIDIVANSSDYCIRAYNPRATHNSIGYSHEQGANAESCVKLLPSSAAGGPSSGSLRAWWKFNNDVQDSSGSGNHGTATNLTSTVDKNGRANSAYSFNGSTSRVLVSNSINLQANSFTVSAWFKASSGGDRKIVSTSTRNPLQMFTGGQLRACVLACVAGGPNTADNQWHFAATVGSASSTAIYLDGGTVPVVTMGAQTASMGANVRIGQDIATGTFYYNGQLDDIRIYDTPFSVDQLKAIYERGPQ